MKDNKCGADDKVRIMAQMTAAGHLKDSAEVQNSRREESLAELKILRQADTWFLKKITDMHHKRVMQLSQ